MKEHFLSYEQSLAFKDLGFDEPCFGYYSNSKEHMGEIWYEMPNGGQDYIPVGDVLAPLKSQFFKWVREKKIRFYITSHLSDLGIFYKVIFPDGEVRTISYDTYEEAEDACIDKIIELLKLK